MITMPQRHGVPKAVYGQLPLTFTPNAGQVRDEIRYVSNHPGCKIGFLSDSVQFLWCSPDRSEGMSLLLQFCGANSAVEPKGELEHTEKVHYFLGNDPSKWMTDLATYKGMIYREPWPGIDLHFYGDGEKLKYDIIVRPGARLDDIRFVYSGADGLTLDEDGHLRIHTAYGELMEERPVSYQYMEGSKVQVESRFILHEGQGAGTYGFEVGRGYNPDLPLVIDPALFYSTYLGGSDADAGLSIAADNEGNAYVTGQTLSFDFPIAGGAFQPGFDASSTAFVTKLNPFGTAIIYSTFLGGSSADQGNGIAVDPFGNAYVTGQTLSPNFPTTPNAFQPFSLGNQDAFVTKLSSNGNSLIYSTFLGGQGVDAGVGIAIDSEGNAYVTGSTSSIDFPVTPSAFQPGLAGNLEDAFVTKLNADGTGLQYSTFLGGFGVDEALGIAVDGSGNAYVAGFTTSFDFPTTPGAFQIFLNGVIAAFVSKLNFNGSELLFSTYLGGSGDDEARGIAVDEFGQAYVAGRTTSPDFPTTFQSFQPFYNGGSSDAFVTKLSPEGNYLVYSTFLGGSESDAANGIAVRSGLAYVAGNTGSFNFPVTPDAIQHFTEGGDGFLTQLNIDGASLIFSTFIGGSSNDADNAIAVDSSSNVYLTGQTFSTNFPVTPPNVVQPFLRGGGDAFVMKFSLGLELFVKKFTDRFEVAPGEQVTYFIDLHNPSAATITNVIIEDPLLGIFHIVPEIPPFSSIVFEFHFIVPPDTPFGLFRNVVRIRADQIGEPIEAEAEINVTGTPLLLASKTVEPPAAAPGDTVIFIIQLENRGTIELINVRINDPFIGLDEFIGNIPVGETLRIDWPFQIPFDAIAGFTISNIAVITADNLPHPEEVGTVVEVLPVPRLEIDKTADRAAALPGETIIYTIHVANTGNSEVTNIKVNDDVTGFETLIPILFPGQGEVFTIPFIVPLETPPQVYLNTATVVSDQTEFIFDTEEVVVLGVPRLGISKVPDTPFAATGQNIRYTVTLENIGNVPLTGVRIIDPLLGIDIPVPNLEVGEIRHLEFEFTVPRDFPIGSVIVNILTVETAETGPQETESLVTVTGFGLSLLKEADVAIAQPGETVTYTLTVTNLLGFPQTNVVLDDALFGLSETIPVLQANESVIRTFTFTVPADAVPGSIIRNTFIASSDQTPQQETINDVVVLEPPGPAIVIQKLPGLNAASPGETITYTLTVTNLRNFPQTNVVLLDEQLGFSETLAVLLANETITRTVTFVVPAGAVIGSIIRNTFIVSSDQAPEQETIAEVEVQTPPGPSLLIHKLADRNTAAPGETITYTLTLTNLLGVIQTNIVFTDPLLGFSETIAVLLANETITRTATLVVPADAVIGSTIRNTLTAVSDQSPSVETAAEVEVEPPPVAETTLTVRKRPDRTAAVPGETIRYTVEVTNTGRNPATNVVVSDSLTGEQRTIAVIAPGETERVTFAFTVPAGTVQGRVMANRVTVTWPEQPPGSLPVEDEARVIVADPAELPDVSVEAKPEAPKPGDKVQKTITVTNVTSLPITNVRVFDPLLGFRTVIPSLAPGESQVFTLELPIPAGTEGGTVFRNTVSVFSDETPLQQEEVTVQTQSLPNAALTESVDRPFGRAGETVFFTIVARNTGNVPLLNARLTAPLLGVSLRIVSFEVGAIETLRIPFVLPEVEEDTVIVSPATLVSDNGPTRQASASVTVLAEDEE
ncbi:DUF7507 domain-containing protein [Paenibacillus kobensis]|uniref:DUF7507 domain-containing protein n=1 Tax=Paenibacillus kobensis TaxID=59841 RepID=UPI0013E2CD3A|nr:SBBP repeat-containing protein [Paenibacillus kobensis]